MSTIVVNAVPPEENIMPTSRPSSSVFGIDLPVQDTPRSMTILSREQLSQVDIQDARDYAKLTSDAYTESDFGTPAVPSIRGQPADVFINGQRAGWNADGNGPPVDFNNIESVDVVKGPPDATSGSSVFVGGYVDEITKKPYFDKFQGDASATIGMYDQFRQTLDFGGPIINNELAYRISYSGSESGSYYDFVHNDSQYGYAALTWIPSDKYTLDANGSFGEVDYLENNGFNRVTQNLIDNGQYVTGGGGVPPGGGFNVFTPTGTTQLSRSIDLHNPNDGAYAKTFNGQVIQTLNVNDDLKIVDNAFGQYLYWRTYNAQAYDQLSNGDYSLDNKIYAVYDTDIPVIDPSTSGGKMDPKDTKDISSPVESDPGLTFHNTLNAGVEFRYQYNDDYQTFQNEPFNYFDLSLGGNNIFNQAPGFGAAPIPSLPGNKYYFDTGAGFVGFDNGNSETYETGFYLQDVLKFTPQWSLIYGARADILYVNASTPEGTPTGFAASDYTTQVLPNFNVSPTYKPVDWATLYFTYNRGQAPGNTGQTGSFSPLELDSKYFHQYATMEEAGAKFDLIHDKLFTTLTYYHEERYDPAADGSTYKQRIDGIEWDLDYQPDKHFYATASYSYAYSHDIDPGFQHETNATYTTGVPVLSDDEAFTLSGDYKSPGFPNHVFNALAVYKFDFGLGVSADLQVTSPIDVAWVGNVEIPWQYNVDFSAFYTYKQSEVKVSVYNATDEKNWGSTNPIYGLDSIFAEEPIHVEGTVKIHF